jgi:hypothetical protein
VLYETVAGHALLSGEANALQAQDNDAFEAQQLLAEQLLGFAAPAATDLTLLETAQLALVLQINWQLATKLDPYIYKQIGSAKMAQQRVFLDGGVPIVSPQAEQLAATEGLMGTVEDMAGAWGSFRSSRGPQT